MTTQPSPNAFRVAEKRFKLVKATKRRKGEKKNVHTKSLNELLSEVIDVDRWEASRTSQSFASHCPHDNLVQRFATCEAAETRIYSLSSHPGLYLLRAALNTEQCLQLAERSLNEWAEPPNRSNLTATHGSVNHIWLNAIGATQEQADRGVDTSISSSVQEEAKKLLEKRRWVTLGGQYNWTTRKYEDFLEFPADLFEMARRWAASVNFDDYVAEAAIINYYFHDSVLCGHLDDAESTMDAPIVSISLGLDAIFLIGAETKAEEPTPILLRHGDVLIMGGRARMCVHGVPRILQRHSMNEDEAMAVASASHSASMLAAVDYLRSHRVNLNVRQCHALNESTDA